MLQAKDNLKPLVVSIRDIVEVCSNYDLPTPHQVGTVADNAEIPVGDPAQGGSSGEPKVFYQIICFSFVNYCIVRMYAILVCADMFRPVVY
jgi:hypothetical protein